jgi:hypothetical protein
METTMTPTRFAGSILIVTCALLVINTQLVAQAPLFVGELQLVIVNPSTSVPITVEAVGVVWGSKDNGYPITHAFDRYDTVASGFYADNVDNCCASFPPRILGYGKYKITITKGSNTYTAYADYRDCDYQTHNNYFNNLDISITFDYNNNRFNGDSDVQI